MLRIIGGAALLALLVVRPVWAQMDLAGEWASRPFEDTRARGGEGAHIGDYTGIPLNEAGRIKAESWDASILSQREQQAKPHPAQYFMHGPGPNIRIDKIEDPITHLIVAYTIKGTFGRADRTIWLDGRPHPSKHAEHTWQGFSTGEWHGNVLTVTTTHIKTGWLNRNGTPSSSHATVIEHFIRHGDQMTDVIIVDDPAYLEEPLIRTTDFVWAPNQEIGPPQVFEIVDEITDWPKGYVPSYALGARHTDWAEYVGLPFEASRGGKATTYPDYLPTLRKMVSDYQAAKAAAATKPDKPTAPDKPISSGKAQAARAKSKS